MPGFFDLSDPQSSLPLLGLLQGLGQAAAPSRTPVPFGEVIGQAAQGYMGGQQAAQQAASNALDMKIKNLTLEDRKSSADWVKNFLAGQSQPISTPPAPTTTAGGPSDPNAVFDDYYTNHLLPHEGTAFTHDPDTGVPSKFGINQAANPGVDVKSLTADQAKDITKNRYWIGSGSASLAATNPQLAAVNMEAAFAMGPGAAKKLLDMSGGDPQKYLALLKSHYQAIAQANPAKAMFLSNWMKRTDDLGKFITTLPGQTQIESGINAAHAIPAGTLAGGGNPQNMTPFQPAFGLPGQPTQVSAQPPQAPQAGAQPTAAPPDLMRLTDQEKLLVSSEPDPTKQRAMISELIAKHERPMTDEEKRAHGYDPRWSVQVNGLGVPNVIDKHENDLVTIGPEDYAKYKVPPQPAGTTVQVNPQTGELHINRLPVGYATTDEKTTDYLAHRYLNGDTSVLQGRGQAQRNAITARAQAISDEMGSTPEADMARGALVHANQQALGRITFAAHNINQSENTVIKNTAAALAAAPQGVGPTGMPVFDAWIQAGRKGVGDDKVVKFNALIQTAAAEYARAMTTGPTGNGVLSDHSQKLYNDLLNNASNLQQLKATFDAMKIDMANRVSSYSSEQGDIIKSIGGDATVLKKIFGANDSSAPTAAPTGQKVVQKPQSEINSDAAAMGMTPGNFLWFMRTKHGVLIQATP
jgi:hypothetical protein